MTGNNNTVIMIKIYQHQYTCSYLLHSLNLEIWSRTSKRVQKKRKTMESSRSPASDKDLSLLGGNSLVDIVIALTVGIIDYKNCFHYF
jgi:hypothetical protein